MIKLKLLFDNGAVEINRGRGFVKGTVIEAWERGYSIKRMCQEFGLNKETVRGYHKLFKLKRNRDV